MLQPWFPDRNNSRAVLIGASTFPSTDLPDLPAVTHNLDALEQVLTDPQHGVIGACTVLAEQDVTDAKIGVALAQAAREATDLLLVYYAGHGVLDEDGRLHLARPDTNMDYVGWTSVSVDLLKRDLSRARARARVLVLDCCFSGRAIAAMADSRSLVAGQLDLSGTYTLTSTTATAPSHAPPGKRYTSFTNAMLGALAQPDPLTLDDIYLRIDGELDSLGLPRPQHNATNNAATLALTRGPVLPSIKRPKPKNPPPEPLLLATHVFTTGATGKLEIDQQHLAVQRIFGRQARLSWSLIHTIRVVEVKRTRLRSRRCKIEIEFKEPLSYKPDFRFIPVPRSAPKRFHSR